MNQTQSTFSLRAVALSVFAAAAAASLSTGGSARSIFGQELLAAVLLAALSARTSCFWTSDPPKWAANTLTLLLQVWLAVELGQTFLTALHICREEFSSLALLGFLPLLLWAGWRMPAHAWNAPAQVLWWFVAGGAVM